MIISREDFITEMASRNGVTKKASREFTEMFLNTFIDLLLEGNTIRFWNLFTAKIITSSMGGKSLENTNSSSTESKPYKRFSIKVSKVLKDEVNEIMNEEEGQ